MARTAAQILADNILALKGDKTYRAFPAKVSQGTIARVTNPDSGQNVRLSTLASLARGFRLEAWELLFPDFDPADPPGERQKREQLELEELRQWRDEIMQRARKIQHGTMVDARGPDGSDGDSKGKGKQPESRYKGGTR